MFLSIARKMRFQPKAASRSQQLCKDSRVITATGSLSRAAVSQSVAAQIRHALPPRQDARADV